MIGIVDSGLGGIVTLHHILKYVNDTSFVCVADQANAPYGEKSIEELEKIARKHLLWFQSRGITTVIVACNTLCSTVIPKLKKEFVDMQIVDIISLTCNALKDECISSLLLLATKRSIESKVYEQNIQAMFPNCTIYPVVPSLWVPSIENQVDEVTLNNVVKDVVIDYVDKVDSVLLGCTHYPLVKSYIQKYLPVKMYDSCDAIVDVIVHEHLQQPSVCIFTSGDPDITKKQVYDLLQMDVEVLKL